MLLVGWYSLITCVTMLQVGFAYAHFKNGFTKPKIRNFCDKEPTFGFYVGGCLGDVLFLIIHAVFHMVAAGFLFYVTDYYHILVSSLGDFEGQMQGQYMMGVFENVSTIPSAILGLRILLSLCYVLLVFLLTLVQRHFYFVMELGGKVILKVVMDGNGENSSSNTIKYDGISIVKTDGSVVKIDLREDFIRFLSGVVFVTGLKPGEWKAGFKQDEVAKIVADGNGVHEEVAFDPVSQHWQSLA